MSHEPDRRTQLTQDLQRVVALAVLAPSSHNAQPWRFHIGGGFVELRADRLRALPVVDPDDRELTIACGRAQLNLRVALRAEGFDSVVTRLPSPSERSLLARVDVRPGSPPTADERRLCEAIVTRHTAFAPYSTVTVADEIVARLGNDAALEGVRFHALGSEAQRVALVSLVMEADHRQWSDPRFRRELAEWTRSNDSDARDGVPGNAVGLDNVASHLARFTTRVLDKGTNTALHDRDLADASPLLAVLATSGDTPLDWLCAGEGLGRVLLRAEVEGLAVAFLNPPVEVPELRTEVDRLCGEGSTSQIALRIGYGPAGIGTPRRPVADVLDDGPAGSA